MIPLTKIKGERIWVNQDLIETISSSPDTVIMLTNGKAILVQETPEEVRDKVIAFRRQVIGGPSIIKAGDS